MESSAKIGNWSEFDKIQITVLKLTEVAKVFYSSNPELQNTGISWENFKAKFLHRFRDVRSDQHHLMQLQTAKQKQKRMKVYKKFGPVPFTSYKNSP